MSISLPVRPVIRPDIEKEIALLKQGYRFIAGIDEAGRGAWAGPVVAAAVILPLDRSDLVETLAGLRDSKTLNQKNRERFLELIQITALGIAVGLGTVTMIDELNVLEATRYAMQQAVSQLKPIPDCLLLDYIKLPAISLSQEAFPKADAISLSVAAASVVAKVIRDQIMVELNEIYPDYAFNQNKGYGTKFHQAALAEYGPCPWHRMSFKPFKEQAENSN